MNQCSNYHSENQIWKSIDEERPCITCGTLDVLSVGLFGRRRSSSTAIDRPTVRCDGLISIVSDADLLDVLGQPQPSDPESTDDSRDERYAPLVEDSIVSPLLSIFQGRLYFSLSLTLDSVIRPQSLLFP